MKIFWKFLFISALPLALLACGEKGGSGGDGSAGQGGGEDATPVIARVGDLEITQKYFDFRYESLAPQEKARFSGENWKTRFLDYLIQESLLYGTALDENYDQFTDVAQRLDMLKRAVLVRAYHDKKFKEQITPSEEQIRSHYEKNQNLYVNAGRVYGYHIQNTDKAKLDAAYQELQAGKRFAEVALKYTQDQNTREKGGELGWFNPDGYVLGIGYNKEFTDLAFSLPANGISSPTKIGDNWHVIKIGPKSEDSVQTLEEAHESIVRTLAPILVEEAFQKHLKELRDEIQVARFGEYQELEVRTAEQLYQLGGESRSPHAKLDYYQALSDKYPEHKYADDALFMFGFIKSEEFNEIMEASVAFRRLLAEYPESEFTEQALWMLNNLGTGAPEFRGRNAPQDPAEAAQRIDAKKG